MLGECPPPAPIISTQECTVLRTFDDVNSGNKSTQDHPPLLVFTVDRKPKDGVNVKYPKSREENIPS